MTTILIADDEESIRTILSRAMEGRGHSTLKAATGNIALDYLKTRPVDVAFVDIRMPGISGLEILNHQGEFPSRPAIFVITAQDTMENTIEAMKRGAFDYLTKPFDLDELAILVDRALETRRLREELASLKEESQTAASSATLVGKSRAMREIFKTIGRIADQDATVLIQGESGTGKELVARAIHTKGKRAPHPFVAVNCSAIPANLLESELFGHKKGSFTGAIADKTGYFERAHRGTLFLDEIADLPLPLQAKLLRVLQEKEVQKVGDPRPVPIDVRIIAATNQKLERRIPRGLFREDLYFRLNVVPIEISPLRERKEDIPPLANHFLKQVADGGGGEVKKIDKKGVAWLEERPWPGNIRELENLLKRAAMFSQGGVLTDVDLEKVAGPAVEFSGQGIGAGGNLEEWLHDALKQRLAKGDAESLTPLYDHFLPMIERPLIRIALAKCRGNQIKAAALLGINRNTLRKKIRELKVDRRSGDK